MKRILIIAVALVATAFFACNRESETELTKPPRSLERALPAEVTETGTGPDGFSVLLPHPVPLPENEPFVVSHPQELMEVLTTAPGTLDNQIGITPLPGIPDSLQPGRLTLPPTLNRSENRVKTSAPEETCLSNDCHSVLAARTRFLQELAEATCTPQGMYVLCCEGLVQRMYFLVATPGIRCQEKTGIQDQ